MKNIKPTMLLAFSFFAIASYAYADTSSTVRANNGSCPSGSNHAGSGYCTATGNWAYVPANNGSCPSGTNHAGAGYCKTDGMTDYVRANNGSCPSGYNHAGSGYCKK